MFCRNCGKEVPENAVVCVSCGCFSNDGNKFCPHCGSETIPNAVICVKCGVRLNTSGYKAKTAVKDSLHSIKAFSINPVGGLKRAFESLSGSRAIGAGLVFAIIFDLCLLIGLFIMLHRFRGFMDTFLFPNVASNYTYSDTYSSGFMNDLLQIFKLIILGIVPLVSITLSSSLSRKIFRGQGSFAGDIFIAGASLLPYGFFLLLSSILGMGNIEVIIIIAVFAICYTILMIYSGCTQISKISDAGAAIAVPIMLLLSGWLFKIIFTTIF